MLRVFVSFSEKNTWMVDSLDRMSNALGTFKLYRFDHDPRPGVLLSAKVKQEIRNADVVLVLLTRDGDASRWVQQEIGIAAEADRFIVPIVEKGVSVKGILEGREYIKFDESEPAFGLVRAARVLERIARSQTVRAQAQAAKGQAFALGLSLVSCIVGFAALTGNSGKKR
jgi:hypothetical protein